MMYKVKFLFIIGFISFIVKSQNNNGLKILDAVNESLNNNPVIKRNQMTYENASGNLLIRKSDFDYRLITNFNFQHDNTNLFDLDSRFSFVNGTLRSNANVFNLGLIKKFRTGLRAELSLNTRTNLNNLPFNRFGENISPYIENHAISSTFSLAQPLLRGRGKKITAAFETASKINLDGTESNIEYLNSIQFFKTASFYWKYLASFKTHNIYKQNENRIKLILEITKDLVKGDKKPESDIVQINAELANQERLTNNAKLALTEAKINLGREMGFSKVDTTNIKIPIDEFPVLDNFLIESIDNEKVNALALSNRKDLKFNVLQLEIRHIQLKFYENLKKPQLDLKSFINYGGENVGNGLSNLISSFNNYQGRNVSYGIGLEFTFDLNNNFAKGNFIQNKYSFLDKKIEIEDFKRNLEADVINAINNLKNSNLALSKSKQSLDFYKEVFSNENIKFQNGMTTLLNLVILQERLTFAELEYINAQLGFAIAILNLRFETGTLLGSELTNNLFYSLPN